MITKKAAMFLGCAFACCVFTASARDNSSTNADHPQLKTEASTANPTQEPNAANIPGVTLSPQDTQVQESPLQLQVQVEYVDLSHETLTKLLFLRTAGSSDATDLRKQVQDLVDQKQAKILETQIIACRSGESARTESVHEFMFPTEYNSGQMASSAPSNLNMPSCTGPPSNDKASGGAGFMPMCFETRNLGGTLEVEPTIAEDGRRIGLRFVPEFVWHTGSTVWHEGTDANKNPFKVSMPDIYTLRMSTAIDCVSGQYHLAATLSPKNDQGEVDTSRKVIVFVKCDILKVK